MTIILFIVGLVVGYIIAMVRFSLALKNNPGQFSGIIGELGKKQINHYHVYIEEDNGKYFAYSLQKNTYEGMAESRDELIENLCIKYSSYDIVVTPKE